MHLVKNSEEPSVWKIEVFVETVDRYDHLVGVAAIALLDCWLGVARDSAFRQ